MNLAEDAPYHAHIYFSPDERSAAEELRSLFRADPGILFVGQTTNGQAGPHPIPQYEVHFLKRSVNHVSSMIRASGLRALVHPLTHDDLADHTTLAEWFGVPVDLDLTTLDPPGMNKGVARFGKSDF
jgi:aromatic ring-cleaving dioxygenase